MYQGCKLSPTLFSLYINDLANDIKQMRLGIDIDDQQLSLLLYADDIALIAPDAQSLQLILNKLNEWCSKWRLSIYSDKTKIVHFRPASVLCCNDLFSCGHLNIEKTEKYKYLGLWFHKHLDLMFATSELAMWSKSNGKCWEKRFLKFIHGIGLSHLFEQDTVCVAKTIKVCKAKLIEMDKLMWKINLFNDERHPNGNILRTYRLYQSDLETELYVN